MTAELPPTPPGFEPIPDGAIVVALAKTWEALDPDVAVPNLCTYYEPSGNYAGTTFVEADPGNPNAFTAGDLFAVTLLSVDHRSLDQHASFWSQARNSPSFCVSCAPNISVSTPTSRATPGASRSRTRT